ncbi:hypothetical protein [Paenibacillus sp. PvR148]
MSFSNRIYAGRRGEQQRHVKQAKVSWSRRSKSNVHSSGVPMLTPSVTIGRTPKIGLEVAESRKRGGSGYIWLTGSAS